MPQENLPDSPEMQYYFAGPVEDDGSRQVFVNKDNLPAETIEKFEKFKNQPFLPFRFAFDPKKNKVYIQDASWEKYINEGGDAWKLWNDVLAYVRDNLVKDERDLDWGYGEPPATGRLRKLSDYGQAWNYITEYISSEFKTPPVDVDVVEYVLDEGQPLESPFFSPKGGTKADITVNEPAIFISKPAGKRVDYIAINQSLITTYFAHFEEITKTSQDMEKKINLVAQMAEHYDSGGYDLYYAIPNTRSSCGFVVDKFPDIHQPAWKCPKCGKDNSFTKIYEIETGQRNRIVSPDAVLSQPGMEDYRGPEPILFSYLPARNMLTFQNWHPNDMKQWKTYNQMYSDIMAYMTNEKSPDKKPPVEAFDDRALSPFVTKISSIRPLWDAIKKLCKKNGITPKDVDVLETPLSKDMSTKAMFIFDPKQESEKIPDAQEARISRGIGLSEVGRPGDLTPPYLAVESRISSVGEKYHAMFHEYVHFFQISIQNMPHVPYSFKGGPNDATSEDERMARFIEYIRNEREHDAHMQQMLYMLENQWSPNEVLDWFADKRVPIARVEYRRILNDALREYRKEREERLGMAAETTKEPAQQKVASLYLGVNDWWYMGLQENINEKQHYNDMEEGPPGIRPYNRKEQKKIQPHGTTEELLHKKHDQEMSSQKTVEQLLRESQI
jgi:hypothetical protein